MVANQPSAPAAPSGASTPSAGSDWCVKSQVITEATIIITTTDNIPVSLEVGFANFLAAVLIFPAVILYAFLGLVSTVTNRALIVLSSSILQTGFAVLSARLTAIEATIMPPAISSIQCIPR